MIVTNYTLPEITKFLEKIIPNGGWSVVYKDSYSEVIFGETSLSESDFFNQINSFYSLNNTYTVPPHSVTIYGYTPTPSTKIFPTRQLTAKMELVNGDWVADLEQLRADKLALIRQDRDELLLNSDLLVKLSSVNQDGGGNPTLCGRAMAWSEKLRAIPETAKAALPALDNPVLIAEYQPDFSMPDEVVILSKVQLLLGLASVGILEADILPAFNALPTQEQLPAQIKWSCMQRVSRNDPLVDELGAALNKTPAEIDALFEMARYL